MLFRSIEILGRHSKPNVMITGDAGVGKTALVDGLAYRIINKDVPSYLEGTTVYELDTGTLIAGATYKGEIEDRLKNIIKKIRTLDKSILFIVHRLGRQSQGAGRCAAFRTGIAQLEGLLHAQVVHSLDFQNRPGEDVDLVSKRRRRRLLYKPYAVRYDRDRKSVV